MPTNEEIQAQRLERAQSRSLMICTPIARHPCRQYTFAALQTIRTLSQLGIDVYLQTICGNSNLAQARNELAALFLTSCYTDCLLVDDDMNWVTNDVLRLLASDKPLIGAVGSRKVMLADTDPDKWCVRTLGRDVHQDGMGAIEIEAIGTGFLKISREVFENLAIAHPEWKRKGPSGISDAARKNYYRFFRFDDFGDGEISEDFRFCLDWRAIGGEVWCDPAIQVGHVGEYEFKGHFGALLESV
jgi:hypothetical protein